MNGKCECGDADCDRPGKHPRTKHGFKDATTNIEQVRGWWREYPNSNIGIATGRPSGLLAIDVDGDSGERSWYELLKRCG